MKESDYLRGMPWRRQRKALLCASSFDSIIGLRFFLYFSQQVLVATIEYFFVRFCRKDSLNFIGITGIARYPTAYESVYSPLPGSPNGDGNGDTCTSA
jgi:hypothetical protein